METLFNGRLSIEVSAHGAELCSIFSNGKEYLWQADPAFWKRHSPVLFPIVGSVWENEYRNEDTTYVLTQHGFARDMEFTLISEENDEVRYQLVSNEETLKKYPFPFRLTIGYRIREKKVDVMWEVENTGEKEMHFQIGAHPAFYYPDFDAETQERGFFGFNKKRKETTGEPFEWLPGPSIDQSLALDLRRMEVLDFAVFAGREMTAIIKIACGVVKFQMAKL